MSRRPLADSLRNNAWQRKLLNGAEALRIRFTTSKKLFGCLSIRRASVRHTSRNRAKGITVALSKRGPYVFSRRGTYGKKNDPDPGSGVSAPYGPGLREI